MGKPERVIKLILWGILPLVSFFGFMFFGLAGYNDIAYAFASIGATLCFFIGAGNTYDFKYSQNHSEAQG